MRERRYRIVRKLAEGGSGETYLVWDKRLERNWVMKRIALGEAQRQDAALREVAALRQIHREGIPVLADVFYEEAAVCLIMEYMEGVSLEEKIREEGPMEEETAVRCALSLAELIWFLHLPPLGMIHGDLKPLNLVYHDGRIALLDFGGAVWECDRAGKQTAGCCYTPGYGAPELLQECGVSQKSDIYAFGAVLFYLVTGEQPCGSRGIYAVREENPFLSEKLQEIILKCTETDPEKRYGSMEEICSQLQHMTAAHSCGRVKRQKTGKDKRQKERKQETIFRRIRSVLLTEGKYGGAVSGTTARSALLLAVGLLSFSGGIRGVSDGPERYDGKGPASDGEWVSAAQAQPPLLPVSIRTKEGELFLVDFDAVYHTDENLMFELPVNCFEKGREYEVTISQSAGKGELLRQRTFVICAD